MLAVQAPSLSSVAVFSRTFRLHDRGKPAAQLGKQLCRGKAGALGATSTW